MWGGGAPLPLPCNGAYHHKIYAVVKRGNDPRLALDDVEKPGSHQHHHGHDVDQQRDLPAQNVVGAVERAGMTIPPAPGTAWAHGDGPSAGI